MLLGVCVLDPEQATQFYFLVVPCKNQENPLWLRSLAMKESYIHGLQGISIIA
jgi:hypothetical protein